MRENIENLRNVLKPESLFVSTLEKYQEQTEDDLKRLDSAIEEGNRDTIKVVSHKIKGGAILISAEDLINPCYSLESNAHTLPAEDISRLREEIGSAWQEVSNTIAECISP